jgi:hypothetical protein
MTFAGAVVQMLFFIEWVFVYKVGSGQLPVRNIRTQIHEVAFAIVAGYNPIIYLTFNGMLRKHFCKVYLELFKRCFRRNVNSKAEPTSTRNF